MHLKTKLIVGSLLLGIVPVGIAGTIISWEASLHARATLEEQAKNQLVSIREMKKNQIEAYFQTIQDQIVTFSNDRMVIEAMNTFKPAFNNYRTQLPSSRREFNAWTSNVASYYEHEFGEEYTRRNPQHHANAASFISQLDKDSIALQNFYIKSNPHPLGQKDELAAAPDGTTYSRIHAHYHPHIRDFLKKFGYYDIFLVDSDSGDIVYSVFKELDFSTSLIDGPFAGTGLGKVFQKANAAKRAGEVYLVDFAPYPPSYEDSASFIASPIFDGSTKVGVLIFQMPIDRINAIMTNQGRWKDVGLGNSGETYLIGPDYTMRNQSRFLLEAPGKYFSTIHAAGLTADVRDLITAKKTSIGLQSVKTKGTRAALQGETGFAIFPDYRGVPVLSAYAPLQITGLKWGIMSEIDEEEAFSSIDTLTDKIVFSTMWITGLMLVVAGGVGWMFAIRTTRPIQYLQAAIDSIGRNTQVDRRIHVHSDDEVGGLAQSYNVLLDRLQTVNMQMERASHNVAELAGVVMTRVAPVSINIQQQAEEASTVASSTADMSAMVQKVARNAQHAARLTHEADSEATKVGEVVTQTTTGMTRLAGIVEDSQLKVVSLVEHSDQIGAVTKLIDDIAEQTNLLALNAAIEAARAGDQGRGFAVVADEVRKLAERTTKSTKEITDMIVSMQDETRAAVGVMDKGTHEATRAMELAQQSGDRLNVIVHLVNQVTSQMSEIASATKEQSGATQKIKGNVEDVANVSHQNDVALGTVTRATMRLWGYAVAVQWVAAQEAGVLRTEPEMSLARVGLDPEFLEHLYQTYFNAHVSVSNLLSSMDCEKQKALMLTEIVALLQLGREDQGRIVMDLISAHHASAGMDAALYRYWMDSVLQTLQRFDPKWSPELKALWIQRLEQGLDILSNRAQTVAA